MGVRVKPVSKVCPFYVCVEGCRCMLALAYKLERAIQRNKDFVRNKMYFALDHDAETLSMLLKYFCRFFTISSFEQPL